MDQYSVRMKQELPSKGKWLILLLFFFSLFTLLNIANQPKSGQVVLEAVTNKKEHAQLFWLADGEGYSKENSSRLQLLPDKETYYFRLAPVHNLKRLRLDPSIRDSRIVIKSLALEWDGETAFKLTGVQLMDALSPVQAVRFKFNPSKNSLVAISAGIDPIIEIDAARLSRPYRTGKLFGQAVSALLFTFLIWCLLHYFNSDTFIRSAHTTYPTWKRHWVYWFSISAGAGAFFSMVTPVNLSESLPVIHFMASTVTVGVGLFVFAFWFVTREVDFAESGGTSRWTWIWYALPAYIVWLFYLLSFWPGAMSPDSLDQWKQVLNGHLRDWHPAFHTMTIWLITRIKLSPATVAISQIVALGAAIGWALAVLQRFGVPRTVLWLTSFIVALIPVNGFIVVTLWKDVAYSIVLLILAMYIFQIVMQKGAWLKYPRNWLCLGVVLALVSLYRHNGIVPACGTGILLLIYYRKYWKGLVISIAVAVLIHTGIRGPLYDALDVRRGNPLTRIENKLKNQIKELFAETQEATLMEMIEQHPIKQNKTHYSTAVFDRIYSASPVWRILPMTTFHRRIEYVNLWEKRKSNDEITIKYVSSNKLGIGEASFLPQGLEFLYQVFIETRNKYFFWMWRPAVFLYILASLSLLLSWRLKESLYLVVMPALLNSLPMFLIVIHKAVYRYHYPVVILGILLVIPLLFLRPVQRDEYSEQQ